jgi:hypothetical protein
MNVLAITEAGCTQREEAAARLRAPSSPADVQGEHREAGL